MGTCNAGEKKEFIEGPPSFFPKKMSGGDRTFRDGGRERGKRDTYQPTHIDDRLRAPNDSLLSLLPVCFMYIFLASFFQAGVDTIKHYVSASAQHCFFRLKKGHYAIVLQKQLFTLLCDIFYGVAGEIKLRVLHY